MEDKPLIGQTEQIISRIEGIIKSTKEKQKIDEESQKKDPMKALFI